MSEYYPQFLTSMSGVRAEALPPPQKQLPQQQPPQPPQPPQSAAFRQPHLAQQQQPPPHQRPLFPPQQLPLPLDVQPLALPIHLQQPLAAGAAAASANDTRGFLGPQVPLTSFQSLAFFGGAAEPLLFSAAKAPRNRRKSAPGAEYIKHRRTRSGCYTCRTRRIKCDEGRPICERCKKGKRDCSYPETPSSTKPSALSGSSSRETSTTSLQASPESEEPEHAADDGGHDDREDKDEEAMASVSPHESRLDPIPDDDGEGEMMTAAGGGGGGRQTGSTSRAGRPGRKASAASLLSARRGGSGAGSGTGSSGSGSSGGGGGSVRSAGTGTRQGSEETTGSSPATSTGTAGTAGTTGTAGSRLGGIPSSPDGNASANTSSLPADVRFLLGYFCDNITHLHYCLPTDSDDFIRGHLPALAVQDEPLLYAVVAFAAYQYILRDGGSLTTFLRYYNQSVRLLLARLQRKTPPSLGTLLTVLQLATIEEYLGDWVNLMGHQKAALEMMMALFGGNGNSTDEAAAAAAMQTPATRAALRWYCRFDVFVGMMGGFATALPRAWFVAAVDHYRAESKKAPDRLVMSLEEVSARLRLLSMDMSMLFAKRQVGRRRRKQPPLADMDDDGDDDADDDAIAIDIDDNDKEAEAEAAFLQEHALLLDALHGWKASLDAIVRDSTPEDGHHPLLVTDFGHAQPLEPGDIVDPYQLGVLYHEPLFGVTMMTCEWQSIVAMHELQAAERAKAVHGTAGHGNGNGDGEGEDHSASRTVLMSDSEAPGARPPATTLTDRAFAICQIFETLERWPASPPGCLIMLQAMLAIAALFLPRDARHHMWIRRKFALIEVMGYIFPITMRTRMAELFGDPSCVRWWLPHDEGFTPILRSVRAFADERNVTAVNAQTVNLREIRHVFSKMQLGEGL